MTTSEVHIGLPLLRELLLFCAIAGILIPLVRRFQFSQVLAFLIVGAAIGPYGFGSISAPGTWLDVLTIRDVEGTRQIAEFGVVFLLFTLGLELSVNALWSMRRWVFGLGNVQILITSLLIGGVAWQFGNSAATSAVLGLALALSSTAIVMQLLAERRELGSQVGRASFAILLMQDLMVVPLLVLVDKVGGDAQSLGLALLLAALKAVLAIALIVLLGKRVAQPLFQRVAAAHQADAFMALTLLVTLGTAAATWAAGLSLALGAFLAGLLLAETAYRHQVHLTIEPFKGLFIGLFFLAVGMGIDLRVLLDQPVWIPLSVLGLFGIKAVVATLAMRGFGLGWATAIEGGLLLGQGGEFAFIVIGIALVKGLLAPDVGQFMLLVVGFSMLAAPLVARLGVLLGQRVAPAPAAGAADEIPRLAGHVLIAGYGRVGQLLGDIFDREGIPYLAIDRDASRVARLHAAGKPVFFGDAEHPDLLPGGLADNALAVIITLDAPDAAIGIARALSARLPGLPVLARARDEAHALALRGAGVERVVPETLEAALQLSGHALEALGFTTEAAQHCVQMEREARMVELGSPTTRMQPGPVDAAPPT